jgi:cytochrome P450 family 112 subfamily A
VFRIVPRRHHESVDLPTASFARPDHVRPSPTMLAERDLPARQVRLAEAAPPVWLLSRYAEVRQVLADKRFQVAPPPETGAALTPLLLRSPGWPGAAEGADLTLLRRLAAPAFNPRRTSALRADIEQTVDRLLDAMEVGTRPVDLRAALTFPLPTRVICALLGIPRTDVDQLAAWSDAVTTPPFLLPEDEASAAWAGLSDYFAGHLAGKRRRPGDDLLTEFAFRSDDIADDVAIGLAIGLFIAGHETTVSQLEHGFLAFFAHRDQLEMLREDPELATSAVEEILRMCPLNAQGVFRYPTEDIEVGGVPIPAGSPVLVGGPAAAFAADVFDDPLRFDITRNTNPHLSFGYGPHYCLGAPLARAQMQTVFGTVFRRFPDLRLAVTPDQLRPRASIAGGFHELPVTW